MNLCWMYQNLGNATSDSFLSCFENATAAIPCPTRSSTTIKKNYPKARIDQHVSGGRLLGEDDASSVSGSAIKPLPLVGGGSAVVEMDSRGGTHITHGRLWQVWVNISGSREVNLRGEDGR